MPRNVYALLVGIDAYPARLPPLRGCVRDIQVIEALLQARTQAAGDTLVCRRLLDAEATRQRVLEGLEGHLTQAGPGDAALFYYAGHGSRQPMPPRYRHLDPARELESLVCFDSRTEGRTDLYDKELAVCIARIAERAGHVLVILDSCHSGSGTKGESPDVRWAPGDSREVDAVRMARMIDRAGLLFTAVDARSESERPFFLPRGRHVLLAACASNQLAAETSDIDGSRRGAFSLFLSEALKRSAAFPTYRDLFNQVNSRVERHVTMQSPVIQSAVDEDFDRPFLGGDIVERERHCTATQYQYERWQIDAGEMQGLLPPAPGKETELALFETHVETFTDLSRSVGKATLTATFPARSIIEPRFAPGFLPDDDTTLRAIVTSCATPPMGVALLGDQDGIARLRAAIASAGPGNGPSLLVREEASGAVFGAHAMTPGHFRITRLSDARGVCADVVSAKAVVTRFHDIARWQQLVSRTPPTSGLPHDAIELSLFDTDGGILADDAKPLSEDAAGEVRLDERRAGDAWKPAAFSIRITNRWQRRLYCMVLELTPGFGIRPLTMSGSVGGGGCWIERGESAWIPDTGATLKVEVPGPLRDLGGSEARWFLRLFASTELSDATLMAQTEPDARARPGELFRARMAPDTAPRRRTAKGDGDDGPSAPVAAWTTRQITLVVRSRTA
jgi:hypothetical protein